MNWRQDAACVDTDPELFFPINEASTPGRQAITVAKTICADCPSQAPCLEFAFTHACMYGVWGGLTATERAKVMRRGNGSPARDPHRIHEIAAMSRQGLTARAIGDRLGMHREVVLRYLRQAREDAS
jgi:WhiB family redox-sensing transcriptional regulator